MTTMIVTCEGDMRNLCRSTKQHILLKLAWAYRICVFKILNG